MKLDVEVEGLRPICNKSSFEVRSLTLFIGKNSTGKSLLMTLLWSVENALLQAVFESALSEETSFDEKLAEYLELVLGRTGIAKLLENEWRLALHGDSAWVSIQGSHGKIVEIKHGIIETPVDKLLKRVLEVYERIGIPVEYLRLAAGLGIASNLEEVINVTPAVLLALSLALMLGRTQGGQDIEKLEKAVYMPVTGFLAPVYVPDGRSGLARIAASPTAIVSLKLQDMHFLDALRVYTWLGQRLDEGMQLLLRELGVEGVKLAGNRVYLTYWWGGESELSEAPSGVREALLLLLLLSSPISTLYIEEPEAHLHPPAVQKLAILLARAANQGKKLIVSTHEPLITAQINDLILAKRLENDKEALRKYADELGVPLDVLEEALLDPKDVVVNLLNMNREGKCVEIETLRADKEGFSEEYFARMIDTLDATRVYLAALLKRAGGREAEGS